ncbi:MAG: hypothetical protein HC842_02425 [Cytophagales bacterium]|nr:hypothetical protein [Cytophagales bacterium]
MICTDTSALYLNQNEDPLQGYRSFSGTQKEACIFRVFNKGFSMPFTQTFYVYQYQVVDDSNGFSITRLDPINLADGSTYIYPNSPISSIFYFNSVDQAPSDWGSLATLTGFVNLRVLPSQDYGRYLDPAHPQYPTPVTWEVIYQEVLQTYALLFPAMTEVLPFTKENWDNGTMAAMMLQRVSLDLWTSSLFMPITRDMSNNQIALIQKWAEGFQKGAAGKAEQLYIQPGISPRQYLRQQKLDKIYKKQTPELR